MRAAGAKGTVTYMGLLSVAADEAVQRAIRKTTLAFVNLAAFHSLLEVQSLSEPGVKRSCPGILPFGYSGREQLPHESLPVGHPG